MKVLMAMLLLALTLGSARALIVNAGNSNAFTGSRGRAAVEAIAARAAAR